MPVSKALVMYGTDDVQGFLDSCYDSLTFQVMGGGGVVVSLLSDAQEEMAHGNCEGARQTINRAKALLMDMLDKKQGFYDTWEAVDVAR